MKYKMNITEFKIDRLKITKEESELLKNGTMLAWLDNSPNHIWPSMNEERKHVCSFEMENKSLEVIN